MTYPAAPNTRPSIPGSLIALRLVLALVSIPIAVVEFFVGGFAIMATDSCYEGSSEFVCSTPGTLLLLSPQLGGAVLGVGCLVLVVICAVRDNRMWWALFSAFWAVAVLTLIAAMLTSSS